MTSLSIGNRHSEIGNLLLRSVPMGRFDRRLKAILLKHHLVDEEKAERATALAAEEDKSLSEVLVAQGHVKERDLIGCVALEVNMPPIDLHRVHVAPEVIECISQEIATSYCIVPISRIGDLLTVAVADPLDVLKLDDLRLLTHCDIRPVLSSEPAIRLTIQRCYSPGEKEVSDLLDDVTDDSVEHQAAAGMEIEEDLSISVQDLMSDASQSPVVKLVNVLILQAIKGRASDIHVEPFRKHIRVRYRQDGVLHETISPPTRMQNAIVSRIKIMAGLDIAERRKPQDGKFQLKVEGRQVDFRVSILPVIHGEKVVLRILDASNLAMNLDSLGWEQQALKAFRAAIAAPWGMILCTGPTGSGKSTTLYSGIKEVMSTEDNLVTVEDPVEYQLEGINQVQVSVKRGLTFAGALRAILRQDPDTIMIGEIRDLETAEIAVQAALTGHLVLSTVHTNDAAGTITRLVDMGIDPFMVASSVVLVVAQRLARRLCPECKEPVVQVPKEILIQHGFTPEEAETCTLYHPKGCGKCTGGYRGRFAVLEPLTVNEEVKRLILDGGSAIDIKAKSLEQGMITLRRCAILNAIRGHTSLEEVLRVTMGD
jgi:type IV pilus assembly protein PilB